ncbi:MAG: hypothetical protein JWR61_3330 [Ferruginibacter sp.]|nr:hypothetical protein [Ferruginibacter sp.]
MVHLKWLIQAKENEACCITNHYNDEKKSNYQQACFLI